MRIIQNKGLLTVTHRLEEGYARPTDVMDAEEVVGQILGDLDKVSSPVKRKRLLKLAMGYMKMFGLDKEKDWMSQYNMRKNSKGPKQEAIEEAEGKLVIYHGDAKRSEARDAKHAAALIRMMLASGQTNIFITSTDQKRTISSFKSWAKNIGDMAEARPGPHQNPWPQKKTSTAEFVNSLEVSARLMGWSPKTTKLVQAIAEAIKRGDKAKVRRLVGPLVDAAEVSGGLVNEINHWLNGWMD